VEKNLQERILTFETVNRFQKIIQIQSKMVFSISRETQIKPLKFETKENPVLFYVLQ